MDEIPITFQNADTGQYYTTRLSQEDASKLFSVIKVNTTNQRKSSSSSLASSVASDLNSIKNINGFKNVNGINY